LNQLRSALLDRSARDPVRRTMPVVGTRMDSAEIASGRPVVRVDVSREDQRGI
jgi:hypothetical protein